MKEFKYAFAWADVQMPRLDPQLVTHKLNIQEGIRIVKQSSRNFPPKIEVQIKHKIKKLVDVSFIKTIQHPI